MKNIYSIAAAFLLAASMSGQVHYSENFETLDFSTWKNSDLDGDGQKFFVANASGIYPNANLGLKTLGSYSYANNTPLSPDNLVTSTPITLPSGMANLVLKYQVGSQNGDYGAEHYAIYLSPTNVPAEVIATTPVKEETLPMAGGMKEVAIDVSSYAGKTVYLSFRHFNCVDMYFVLFDNISIETLQNNNAKLVSSNIAKYIAVNSQNDLKFTIKNQGANPITSVELNWNDGTDHIATVPVNIAVGATATVTHPTKVSYSDITTKNINLTITKVNAGADADPSDNTGTTSTSVASQLVAKKIVLEEGTGTWCGWCPRGMVGLEKVNNELPNDQVSIAVHNQDPMVLAAYNSGAAFNGFPGMNVDRELKGVDPGPNGINNYVTSRKNLPTPVKVSGDYSIAGNQLTANVSSKFFINKPNTAFKLLVVITEDGVKGTAANYGQSNYYAGGGNGPMGGFENLPSTVPAAQMVYDHVGRALLGGYTGQAGSVPAAITDGQTVNYTFNYTIPAAYKAENLHAIAMLIDSDGTILNAEKLTGSLAVSDISKIGANTLIFPNPAKTEFNIKTVDDGKYNVSIFDMSGREVKNLGTVNTSSKNINVPINLAPGKYMVNISRDGVSFSKELLVK
ncbi:Omp28-related outer membrane protein [Soonwooa sp.]|uniref:Omp28-related outer membrane protein n=1 Tax=Soonwooa sp. TaxID=1938592 RepID=UPI00261E107C|nr:Omp28-related outer membrane protein [Soonwooa sp.]